MGEKKIDKIRRLRRLIVKLDLPRHPEFDIASDEEICREYNGIGSKKYQRLIGITTKVFQIFEAPAVIHDHACAKPQNDGSKYRFDLANDRFRAGNKIMAKTCHVWFECFRPQQRDLYRAAGETLYGFVISRFGWECWLENAPQN